MPVRDCHIKASMAEEKRKNAITGRKPSLCSQYVRREGAAFGPPLLISIAPASRHVRPFRGVEYTFPRKNDSRATEACYRVRSGGFARSSQRERVPGAPRAPQAYSALLNGEGLPKLAPFCSLVCGVIVLIIRFPSGFQRFHLRLELGKGRS
jgi:hypothetical protein